MRDNEIFSVVRIGLLIGICKLIHHGIGATTESSGYGLLLSAPGAN